MISLFRACSAELLKLKSTLAFWLALVAPLAMGALQFLVVQRNGLVYLEAGESAWEYYGGQTINFFALLMLPLFVTLETALASNMEHTSQQWKQLFALPLPRSAIYAAKLFAGLVLIGVSLVGLLAVIVLSGWLLNTLHPDLGFGAPIPWEYLFKMVGMVYLGSWLLIAIHTWIGLRWQSFALASAVGIVLTVAGMMVINSDYAPYYPWTLPAVAELTFSRGGDPSAGLAAAAAGFLVVSVLGGWNVVRRDVL